LLTPFISSYGIYRIFRKHRLSKVLACSPTALVPSYGSFWNCDRTLKPSGFPAKACYSAEGKLLFQTDRASSLTGLKNDIGEMVPLGQKSEPLSTEAEIISSFPIAQKTVEALGPQRRKGQIHRPQEPLEKAQGEAHY
jgi:hypothetical protein